MKIQSFIGGTDEQRSNNLSDNQLVNLYPVANNDGSVAAFYKVDGLKTEGTLTGVPTGAYKASNGRAFYTSGTVLYELTVVAGVYTSTSRGTITTATNYEFSDNGLEMIMVNGTDGWIFTFSTNALLKLTVLTGNFTVQPATSVDTDATLTKTSHGLIAGDRVTLTTTGSLPTYLLPNIAYYVLADGLTANAFKVGLTLTGATCTISNSTPCVITSAAHNYIAGDKIRFLTTGALPDPLVVGTVYYVMSTDLTENTFKISLTPTGALINTTTAGSGVHSFNPAITIIQTGMTTATINVKKTSTCTIVNTATTATNISGTIYAVSHAVVGKTAHTLAINDKIQFTVSGGTLPAPLALVTDYYIVSFDFTADSFKVSSTLNGSPITLTTVGSGVFSYTTFSKIVAQTEESHGLTVGEDFYFGTTGDLPNGLVAGTKYQANAGGLGSGQITLVSATTPTAISYLAITCFGVSDSNFSTSGTYLPVNTPITLYTTDGTMFPGLTSGQTYYVQYVRIFYYSRYWVLYYCLSNAPLGEIQLEFTWSPFTQSDFYMPNPDGYATAMYAMEDSKFTVSAAMADQYNPTAQLEVTADTTQSGVQSIYSEDNRSYGTHTYTTGGSGFPNGAKTVSYMNGRFIACDPNTQDFYVSEVLDGKTWDAINVQTVDSNPDYVTGQIVAHNELFVFCENSGETYYDSGSTPTPFVRNLTGIFEVGCKAPYTIKEIGGAVIFLGNTTSGNGIVYQMSGLTPVRISTYSIEYQIQQMSDISDARAITYQKDGHHYYVLTFPTGDKTFVYDASTSMWHERETQTGALSTKTDYATGTTPQELDISSDGLFLYVANYGSNTVSMYSRNTTTGVLSTKTDYATGTNPHDVTISPDGLFLYVSNFTSNSVSMYPRNATTGVLSAKTDYATSVNPHNVAISPDGLFLYVTSISNTVISKYTRNTTTGALSSKTDYATGTNPHDVAISPDGLFLYVANYSSNTISMYSRNTTTGALSVKTDYATGTNPYDIIISPDGLFLYVSNHSSDTVSRYSVNTTTGVLSSKTDYATGLAPYVLAISGNGRYFYVTNYNSTTVSKYSRNPLTGAIGSKTDYTTGTNPFGIAITSDDLFLYVSNVTSNTISVYLASTALTKWPVNKYIYFNNEHLVTDDTTSIFSIDSSTYLNGTDTIRIARSFRAPPSDMKRVAHHVIQVDCEVGIGSVLLTEPVIALRWSDDAGNTWSTAIERGLGLVGDHAKSVIFRRLGSTKGIPRIYELSCDENVKITLLDCYLE